MGKTTPSFISLVPSYQEIKKCFSQPSLPTRASHDPLACNDDRNILTALKYFLTVSKSIEGKNLFPIEMCHLMKNIQYNF